MLNKLSLIPNIKVSYHLSDIIGAFFISSKNDRYTKMATQVVKSMFGVSDVLFTSSGRSALYYILRYLPQRKVIVPAYTCDVVSEAVKLAGKELIFVHVDKNTLNVRIAPELDSDSIFIATHQYGFPCAIEEIVKECKRNNAIVIEDCAGALGTKINGKLAGTYGDFAIFSFNASKLVNSPSTGGFLIAKKDCDLKALKDSITFSPCTFIYKSKNLAKSIAFCLDKNRYVHYWLSKVTRHYAAHAYIPSETYNPDVNIVNTYSFGFYNWQAYVVLKQLNKLPFLLQKRRELLELYKENYSIKGQINSFERRESCIRYPIYLQDRETVRFRLREKGIEVGYGFEHFVCPMDYKEEIAMSKEIAYLPYSSNYSKKEINSIINVIKQESNEQSSNS